MDLSVVHVEELVISQRRERGIVLYSICILPDTIYIGF